MRGAVTYTVSLNNRPAAIAQRVALSFNANPPAVPPQTAVVYKVTARNVDNRECGQDTFFLSPFSLHFVSVTTNGSVRDSAARKRDLRPHHPGVGSVWTRRRDHGGVHRVWPAPLPPNLSMNGTVVYRVR